jgi:dipeptidyl aminopeptidase/acylaminoacyl peptidase
MKASRNVVYPAFRRSRRRGLRLDGLAGCTLAALMGVSLARPVAGQQPRRIQLDDFGAIVRVAEPQLSPDGKSVVCVVGRPNLKDDRYDSSLVLIDIATGTQRLLTQERKGVSSPRWSPSGDRVAFLAQAPALQATTGSSENPSPQPKQQVYVLWMSGGDAQKVTDSPQDVEQFAWSPDGKQLAYVAADEPPNKKAIERHDDAFEVGDNDYLTREASLPSHIWLVASEGGAARRLTSGTWSLPKSAPPSSALSWSPDGKSIALTQQATPYLGDRSEAVIATVDVASGAIRKLTTHKAFERFPLYSPDGSQLAYWYQRDGDFNNETEIYVAPVTGGDGVDLTRSIDRNLVRSIWMPDGKTLLVGGHDGTRVSLWLQPLEGAARNLDLGGIDPDWLFWIEMAVGKDGAIALVGSTPQQPSEVYYMASPSSVPRCLTDFNHTVASRALGRVEAIQWQGPNGFQEDGVVVYPPGFTREKKYPLVLLIHGGAACLLHLVVRLSPTISRRSRLCDF